MYGKLHEYLRQTTLLSLRLCKTKLALHGHAFYFDNTQLP